MVFQRVANALMLACLLILLPSSVFAAKGRKSLGALNRARTSSASHSRNKERVSFTGRALRGKTASATEMGQTKNLSLRDQALVSKATDKNPHPNDDLGSQPWVYSALDELETRKDIMHYFHLVEGDDTIYTPDVLRRVESLEHGYRIIQSRVLEHWLEGIRRPAFRRRVATDLRRAKRDPVDIEGLMRHLASRHLKGEEDAFAFSKSSISWSNLNSDELGMAGAIGTSNLLEFPTANDFSADRLSRRRTVIESHGPDGIFEQASYLKRPNEISAFIQYALKHHPQEKETLSEMVDGLARADVFTRSEAGLWRQLIAEHSDS